MKSAYEKAMERLGTLTELTPAQKSKIADVHSLFESRIAQVRLRGEDELRAVGDDQEKADVIRKRVAGEIAELSAQRDAQKEAVRK